MEELKKLIQAMVISNADKPMTVAQLNRDFKQFEGFNIPYHQYGYKQLDTMLRSMSDAVQLQGQGPTALVLPVTTNKSQHIRKMIVQQKSNGKKRCTPTRHKTQNTWNDSQPRSIYRPVDFARRNDFTTSSLDSSASSTEEAYCGAFDVVDRKTQPATQLYHSANNSGQQIRKEMTTSCVSKSVQQRHEQPVAPRSEETMAYNPPAIPLAAMTLTDRLPATQSYKYADSSGQQGGNEKTTSCVGKSVQQSHEQPVVPRSEEMMAINSPAIPLAAMTTTDRLPAHQLPSSVKPESLFNTYVTSVLAPNNINVHLKYQTEMMVQIEDELEAIYGSADPRSSWYVREEAAKVGLYCVVKYQDIWYRGMIAGPSVEQRVDVFLVDCALKVNVALSDIMHMRKIDSYLPLQTIRVSLAHVKPSEGEWKEEATRFLKEAMCNKVFYMYVVDINTEDDIPDVVFIDVSSPTSSILNGELVLQKHAKWVHEA